MPSSIDASLPTRQRRAHPGFQLAEYDVAPATALTGSESFQQTICFVPRRQGADRVVNIVSLMS